MSDYLPEEVILEILYKLPIKSIVRCTCVCKRWLSLIKNSSFISTHLSRKITSSSSTKDPLILLRHCLEEKEGYNVTQHYSLYFDNQEFKHYMHLHPPFKSLNYLFRVVIPCNGLICLSDDVNSDTDFFILWNPLIGKSLKLPWPPIVTPYEAFIGLGFDSSSNDYKVVRMVNLEDAAGEPLPQVDIFSLNANSWKSITDIAPKYQIVHCGLQAFFNGVVHWIGFRHRKDIDEFSNVVLGLDMGSEVFQEIMLPECVVHEDPNYLNVLVYGESIAVVAVIAIDWMYGRRWQNQHHIWVMKEYGVVRSWTKILILDERDEGLERVGVLGFRKNGEVLLQMEPGRVASCDPESQHISDLRIEAYGGFNTVDTYVESLVLLDKENVVSDATEVIDAGYAVDNVNDDAIYASDAIDNSRDPSNDEAYADDAEDGKDADPLLKVFEMCLNSDNDSA